MQLCVPSEKEKKLAGVIAEMVPAWVCWVAYLEGENGVVVGGVGGGDSDSLGAFFHVKPTPPFSLS